MSIDKIDFEALLGEPITDAVKTLPIRDLAMICALDWTQVGYAARPYLVAMGSLESVRDRYYLDGGSEIVARFLCNAKGWRGPVARAVKAELNGRLAQERGR